MDSILHHHVPADVAPRHIVAIDIDGQRHVFTSATTPAVTEVTLAMWDLVKSDWYYRVVDEGLEVHVQRDGDDWDVYAFQDGTPLSPDTVAKDFVTAIIAGETLFNQLAIAKERERLEDTQ